MSVQDDRADASERVTRPPTIDELAAQLGVLRLEAGSPSYAELAARIARHRTARGVPPERARIARSTVYDVFRPGRRRLDVALVTDLLVALDLGADEVAHWSAVARRAVPADEPAVLDDDTPPAEPASHAPVEQPGQPAPAATRALPSLTTIVLVGVMLDVVGRGLVVLLHLPLHLDMIGTAVAAVLAGPWWGALVAVLGSTVGAAASGPASFPFALVNVAGALVWGYGVHRYGLGRTLPRFFTLNVLCAVVCSCLATPILLLLYGGELGHGSDSVTDHVLDLTHVLALSVLVSNLVISLADKVISGFVALVLVEAWTPDHSPLE